MPFVHISFATHVAQWVMFEFQTIHFSILQSFKQHILRKQTVWQPWINWFVKNSWAELKTSRDVGSLDMYWPEFDFKISEIAKFGSLLAQKRQNCGKFFYLHQERGILALPGLDTWYTLSGIKNYNCFGMPWEGVPGIKARKGQPTPFLGVFR